MSGIALDGADPEVFSRGVAILGRFNGTAPKLLAPNFGVATAALIHRQTPAAPVRGPDRILKRARLGDPVSAGDLQVQICDVTWAKDSGVLPAGATGPIHIPFSNSFKGRSPGVNNWRNSFDLQAGLGCDAPTEILMDASYLAQHRFDCPYRDPSTGQCGSPAGNSGASNRTCFNPSKHDVSAGPGTRARPRPKLLARGADSSGSKGYWVVEPTVDVLSELLADPAKRVPVYPFAAALYGSSPYFSQWSTEVSRERLERDLALGPAEFMALFDVDPESRQNVEMLHGVQRLGVRVPTAVEVSAAVRTRPLSEPVPYRARGSDELKTQASKQADPERRQRLLERANEGHRRTLATLVAQLLELGYQVDEQLDGYDLRASREEHLAHLFEVKTWTAQNLSGQVRAGWAQLHEYRYRNRDQLPTEVRLYLVLDREPPVGFWAWEFLSEEQDVLACWIVDGRLRTLPRYAQRLRLE